MTGAVLALDFQEFLQLRSLQSATGLPERKNTKHVVKGTYATLARAKFANAFLDHFLTIEYNDHAGGMRFLPGT